ncbi:MAG: hypothetical protein HY302_09210 [Opitutae bacterium]|nr:hypothetical protein [Opitutae bacterium]
MKTLTIGQRVAAGFAAVIAIVALVGVVAVWKMNGVSGQSKILAHATVPAGGLVADASQSAATMQRAKPTTKRKRTWKRPARPSPKPST